MANAVATPEIRTAPPPPKIEAPLQGPKGDSKEVKQFGEMAEAGLRGGKTKRTEALAGIAAWKISGKIDLRLKEMEAAVMTNKKITPEKGVELMNRISEIGKRTEEEIEPALKDLDEAIHQEAKSAALSPFMRDLSFHYINREIKTLKQFDSPEAKINLQQHEEDLKNIEAKRAGVTPEQDEVIKLAKMLRGEKSLPDKFKDDPLEAIDSFFDHDLKKIVKNEKMRVQLAQKLELTPEDLNKLVDVYEMGRQMEKDMGSLKEEVYGETKLKSIGKKAGLFGGILGALLAMQFWTVMKKESGGEAGQVGPMG